MTEIITTNMERYLHKNGQEFRGNFVDMIFRNLVEDILSNISSQDGAPIRDTNLGSKLE